MLTVPVINEIGRRKSIHPYPRANLLDSFVNSIPVVIPFLSCLVFIAVVLSGFSPIDVSLRLIYPVALFFVLIFAVITGWGLRYDGENGEGLKNKKSIT